MVCNFAVNVIFSGAMYTLFVLTDDYAKDGDEYFFTKMHCLRVTNLQRLKTALHLCEKFLAAIFSVIVYWVTVKKGNVFGKTMPYHVPGGGGYITC